MTSFDFFDLKDIEIPNNLIINDGSKDILFIELKTGKITYGEGYDPDIASKIFWETMARVNPELLKKEIEELKEENTRLKELVRKAIR